MDTFQHLQLTCVSGITDWLTGCCKAPSRRRSWSMPSARMSTSASSRKATSATCFRCSHAVAK